MYCSNCGKQVNDGEKYCRFCGQMVSGTPVKTAQPQYQQQYNVAASPIHTAPVNETPAAPVKKTNGLGIAGFIVSLVGIIILFTFNEDYPETGMIMPLFAGMGLSLAGLLVGIFKSMKKGLAIAGLAISLTGLLICFVLFSLLMFS